LYYGYKSGVLPDGYYKYNTMIYFCCSLNGNKSQPISLPLEKPFYLLAYLSSDCQAVQGALSRSEQIYYDTDNGNILSPPYPYRASTSSILIYYCYYQGNMHMMQ